MAGVIIGLKRCQLGIDNLDKIVRITKNWHEDPRSSYTTSEEFKTIEEYLNVENKLCEKNEKLTTDFDLFEV
jgi:type I restriction-modification system DNA methylase subunit